jgi:hypothetical protein
MLNRTIAAVCSATVLSLSLISCNAKDPQVATDSQSAAWGLSEPTIISADGVQVKYGEANKKENLTFSVDDRLLMKGISENSGVILQYRTSCTRGGERFQIYAHHDYKREYTLFNFMPAEVFYSVDARPLHNVNCTLEITAINAQGSRHTFPALNLPMVDGGSAKLDLFLNFKKISAEKVDNLFYALVQDIELPAINADEKLSLYCASFVKESADKYVRNIADLKVVKGQIRGDESRSQFCRVIKTRNDTPLAISSFFKIQFYNAENLISYLEIPDQHFKGGSGLNKNTDFFGYRITNVNSEPLYMVWPKELAARVTVSGMAGTSKLNGKFIALVEGAEVLGAKDDLQIRVPPRTSATIKYVFANGIFCELSLGVIRFEAEPLNTIEISLQVTDGSFSDIYGELHVTALRPRRVLIADQGRTINTTDKSGTCQVIK